VGADPANLEEDTWGVFSIDQILKGQVTTLGGITAIDITNPLWVSGDNSQELAGMFWGGTDLNVSLDVAGTQTVESNLLEIAVWEQTAGSYNDGSLGSGARAGTFTYPTVGVPGAAPGASLWLTGAAQPGFIGNVMPGVTDLVSLFNPDPTVILPGGGQGSAAAYISLGPNAAGVGSANVFYDNNFFVRPAVTADMFLSQTTFVNNPTNTPAGVAQPALLPDGVTPNPIAGQITPVFDWTVTDSDPVVAYFVPEPVTLFTAFLGVGALGSYIRKRRVV
jgi:hypothetical protein